MWKLIYKNKSRTACINQIVRIKIIIKQLLFENTDTESFTRAF